MSRPAQIFALSGPDYEPGKPTAYALLKYALGLASPSGRLRLCYVPTAVGDSQHHIDHYNSVFMVQPEVDFSVLKLFPQPSFADMRRHLMAQDVILVEGGSVVNLMALDPFIDGIGLLPYSNGVHDDLEDQPRRETYRRMVADGAFGPGYASEGGVGLHYVGTEMVEAISIRDGKKAWYVEPGRCGEATATAIEPRRI